MTIITTLDPAGDVRRRDSRQNNVSMAARLVGVPGYVVKMASLAVDART